MLRGEQRPVRRVLCGEEQRKGDDGVEGSGLEKADGGVERPTWIRISIMCCYS